MAGVSMPAPAGRLGQEAIQGSPCLAISRPGLGRTGLAPCVSEAHGLPRRQRRRKQEDRIDRAHFGVDGMGWRARRIDQRGAAAREPVKPTASTRIGHQGDAHLVTGPVQQGRTRRRAARIAGRRAPRAAHQFAGAGVRAMRLHDHGTAAGQGGRVSPPPPKTPAENCWRRTPRAGEAHRLDARIGHQGDAHLVTGPVQQGEHAVGQPG